MEKLAEWKCANCGKPLPTGGRIWSSRMRESTDYRSTHKTSGYLCDGCADAKEYGMEDSCCN